jgi:flagellar biosynthesis GTPase FlhF
MSRNRRKEKSGWHAKRYAKQQKEREKSARAAEEAARAAEEESAVEEAARAEEEAARAAEEESAAEEAARAVEEAARAVEEAARAAEEAARAAEEAARAEEEARAAEEACGWTFVEEAGDIEPLSPRVGQQGAGDERRVEGAESDLESNLGEEDNGLVVLPDLVHMGGNKPAVLASSSFPAQAAAAVQIKEGSANDAAADFVQLTLPQTGEEHSNCFFKS